MDSVSKNNNRKQDEYGWRKQMGIGMLMTTKGNQSERERETEMDENSAWRTDGDKKDGDKKDVEKKDGDGNESDEDKKGWKKNRKLMSCIRFSSLLFLISQREEKEDEKKKENRDQSFEKVEEQEMRMEIQVENDAKQKEWIKKCDGKKRKNRKKRTKRKKKQNNRRKMREKRRKEIQILG